MPDLTVTLTAPQVTRIRAALGASSAAEVETLLKAHLKALVRDAEAATEANAKYDAVNAEVW